MNDDNYTAEELKLLCDGHCPMCASPLKTGVNVYRCSGHGCLFWISWEYFKQLTKEA